MKQAKSVWPLTGGPVECRHGGGCPGPEVAALGTRLPTHPWLALQLLLLGVSLVLCQACGGDGQRTSVDSEVKVQDSRDLADLRADSQLDVAANQCEIRWEEAPASNGLQTTEELTHYSRPFFTVCRNGKFHWDDWQYYEEGILPDQIQSEENEVRCPSGECKWGMCKEDAEFIEAQIPEGVVLEDGWLLVETTGCHTCNPNSTAFAFEFLEFNRETDHYCEGSFDCCTDPWNLYGPCLRSRWMWGLMLLTAREPYARFRVSAAEGQFASDGAPCLETHEYDCLPKENARCRPGTATMVTSRWQSGAGSVVFDDGLAIPGEVRLTIGTTSRMKELQAVPQKACDSSKLFGMRPFSYFTCSGMASIGLTDGRWFKFVWIHKYDPANCDKPCWYALEAGKVGPDALPVKMAFWEIPPEPKW